jgi:hypothetical protein
MEWLSAIDVRFIEQRLGELRTIDLKTVGIDDLKVGLYPLLRALTSTSLMIGEGRSIFRVRKHRREECEKLLESVEEIYPKAIYLTGLNRASRKHQPIFYFSADSTIALYEVKAAVGDICTVLECGPRSIASPLLIPIGIHAMAQEHNAKMGGNLPDPASRIRELFKGDEETIHKHELIDGFITGEFLKEVKDGQDHLYKLTIAIAELFFSFETDAGPVDGIAYPSIACNRINANVALLPDAFHRIYKPIACEWMKIEKTLPKLGFSVAGRKAMRVREEGSIEW